MATKRTDTETQGKDVLSLPGGWLVFWMGWTANEPTPAHASEREPFFKDLEEMRQYYIANRARVFEEMGNSNDFWAWHKFEDHDRESCEYCRDHVA